MHNQHIKVGKDVLESLTTSMYEDHRSIYREYIQNSSDQIDKAVELGIISDISDGEIHIDINDNSIEIYDNATGIRESKVYEILGNIALSNKDRENERGFRGIGRLAGLGYCDELIFETTLKGEECKSIMSWNAKRFKEIINDRKHKEEAATVIESIVKQTSENEESDKHYFKVSLKNITNKELLNIEDIREYLSMVAPLPMRNHFIYKNKIDDELSKDALKVDEYNIFVNGDQLYKAYSADIKDNNNKKIDEIYDIDFIKLYDGDDHLLCWGWYGVSNFKGVMTKNNTSRKIRLRKGNIQIGLENTLNKLHKENRGNNYFIGEIHAFHHELIPNARRDYFSENKKYKEFENKLKEFFFNNLHKLYYTASSIRSETKKIEAYNKVQEEFKDKSKKGVFENKEELKKFEDNIEAKKAQAQKSQEKLEKIEESSTDKNIKKIIERTAKLRPQDLIDIDDISKTKPKYRTQKEYPKFDKKTQKIISQIYGVIDDMLQKDESENLKQKIREKLNKL